MRILIIEDDISLRDAMEFHLKREGYEVDCCGDGESAMLWILQSAYDLIILDRMLPGLGGLELLSRIRHERVTVRVLFVTALGTVEDRVQGLDAGADDYLTKPFAVTELLARVRSLLRRTPSPLEAPAGTGDLSLDAARRLLRGPKGCCVLSKRETQLFEVFLLNPSQILPRGLLFSRVWGPVSTVEDSNLDSYIHFLRQRLRETGSQSKLKTVHGVGYRFEPKGEGPC